MLSLAERVGITNVLYRSPILSNAIQGYVRHEQLVHDKVTIYLLYWKSVPMKGIAIKGITIKGITMKGITIMGIIM